jgi:hypothetical protein
MENPMSFVFFPIMIHAFDIIVSSVGIMSIGRTGFGYVVLPCLEMPGSGCAPAPAHLCETLCVCVCVCL